ncbi:hypothetical protein TI39_contig5838g00001 [Zymoseptoria brevis]|uniref:Uncharacterized protein n=1 Tax=Zymoseptoria brevis TaxID=1047168 RepID=A0A0F4G5L6_9PEZI|nr:hypothetical protein TI39_contig5838g00001 [Zymoseptoria brevis]
MNFAAVTTFAMLFLAALAAPTDPVSPNEKRCIPCPQDCAGGASAGAGRHHPPYCSDSSPPGSNPPSF